VELDRLCKRIPDVDVYFVSTTHAAEVAAHADRTFVMHDGELHESGLHLQGTTA
jgi:putative ABC transport system ATP-binding protein